MTQPTQAEADFRTKLALALDTLASAAKQIHDGAPCDSTRPAIEKAVAELEALLRMPAVGPTEKKGWPTMGDMSEAMRREKAGLPVSYGTFPVAKAQPQPAGGWPTDMSAHVAAKKKNSARR